MPKALVDEMIAKEYMGSGKASMEDKVMRRDERSLGSTLVPRSQPPRAPFRPGGEMRFDRPRPEFRSSGGQQPARPTADRPPLAPREAQQSRPEAKTGEVRPVIKTMEGAQERQGRPFGLAQDKPFGSAQDRPRYVFEKKQVNIDDLKKAIEESLQKRKQAEPEEKPVSSVHDRPTEQPKDIEGEVHE